MQWFRTLRELSGFTQAQMARRVAVDQSHYSRVERGVVRPSAELVSRFVSAVPGVAWPPGIQRATVQRAAESEDLSHVAPWIESGVQVLRHASPGWVAETLNALYAGSAPKPTLSVSAEPGLVWLVVYGVNESELTERLTQTSDPQQEWLRQWSALITRAATLAHNIAASQSELPGGAESQEIQQEQRLWRAWRALTSEQQGVVLSVAEALSGLSSAGDQPTVPEVQESQAIHP